MHMELGSFWSAVSSWCTTNSLFLKLCEGLTRLNAFHALQVMDPRLGDSKEEEGMQ